jgi:D-xylose transport system ATP-binding protein
VTDAVDPGIVRGGTIVEAAEPGPIPARVPYLSCRGITKTFGAVHALAAVDLDVYLGEVVALVGDNGAGKSTLVTILSGTQFATSGTITIAGQLATIRTPHDASKLGIETVYQDLALCNNLDVVANLFLGRESTGGPYPGSALSEGEMERRTTEVLKTLHIRIPSARAKAGSLSGGQRQSIAVGRAVLWGSKVVFLDEPTAALGVVQQREVLDLVLRLKQQGLGVVIISHNLQQVIEIADRVVVLRLGAVAANVDRRSVTAEEIVGYITGAKVSSDPVLP